MLLSQVAMAFNSETTVNYGMSVSDKEAFGQSLAHGINLGRQTSCLDKGSASNGNKRLTGSPPKTINKRKLMAKIDWHVLPCLYVMFVLASLRSRWYS